MDHSESSPETIRTTKTALRRSVLDSRQDLSTQDIVAAAAALLPAVDEALRLTLRNPDHATVTAYAPLGTEPGGELHHHLRAAGHRVLLPIVLDDLDLDWAEFTDSTAATHRGLHEPGGPRLGVDAVATAHALLVPALAVGPTGARLGRGGGCYDRALARVDPQVPVIALLHDGEWPREVPQVAHDRPVTGVITPRDGYVPTL